VDKPRSLFAASIAQARSARGGAISPAACGATLGVSAEDPHDHEAPAPESAAGSDPSMMKTTCRREGDEWVVNSRKCFITGAYGATVGIVMATSEEGVCMFLVDQPDPAIRIEHVPNNIDRVVDPNHWREVQT
jgi:hypothetical protein